MQPTLTLRFFQPTRRMLLQPTRRMLRPVPKEEQGAHTISQRLRRLKSIPPELIPLGVVVAFALGAAAFAIVRKFMVDQNLRLTRMGSKHDPYGTHGKDHGHGHGEGESKEH